MKYWNNILFRKYSSRELEMQAPTALLLLLPIIQFCASNSLRQNAASIVIRLKKDFSKQHANDFVKYSANIKATSELTNLSLFIFTSLHIAKYEILDLAPHFNSIIKIEPIRKNISLRLKQIFSCKMLFQVNDLIKYLKGEEVDLILNMIQLRIVIDILIYSWLLCTVLNVETIKCTNCSWKYSEVVVLCRKLISRFESQTSDKILVTHYAYLVTHIIFAELNYGTKLEPKQNPDQRFAVELHWMSNNLNRLIELELWEAVAECIFAFQIVYSFNLPQNLQRTIDSAKETLMRARKPCNSITQRGTGEWNNIPNNLDAKEHMAICSILALAPFQYAKWTV